LDLEGYRMSEASFVSPTLFRQVDAICNRFEEQLLAGQRPLIEEALDGVAGPVRSRALRELLLIEIEYRRAAGERPTAEQYAARFPHDVEVLEAVFAAPPSTKDVGLPSESDVVTSVVLQVTDGPHKGRRFEFCDHNSFIFGRGEQAHFRLPNQDRYFSRIHFLIEVNPPECRLVDLASRNGTIVNGQRVQAANLHDGDVIRAGHTTLQVQVRRTGETPPPVVHASSMSSGPPSQATAMPRVQPLREPPRPPELPDLPGYQDLRELGRGGMGVVYLARRLVDRALFGVKTIRPVQGTRAREIELFLRECQILKSLHHPAIVTFHEFGHTGELLYLVMDYVPGTDAARLLKENGPLPVPLAVDLTCQALVGLQYAHEQGFVHRDLKPANLLVAGELSAAVCRLADFGLAREYQASRVSGLTLLGDMGGTLPYMAPEQITDFRQARPPVDIYSAAATLYHLLTGEYAFDFAQQEVSARLRTILTEPPVPIRARRPEIPLKLADLIRRGLDRDPRKRFASAAEFRQALLQ
jgi:serine/threonine-protein kinase